MQSQRKQAQASTKIQTNKVQVATNRKFIANEQIRIIADKQSHATKKQTHAKLTKAYYHAPNSSQRASTSALNLRQIQKNSPLKKIAVLKALTA